MHDRDIMPTICNKFACAMFNDNNNFAYLASFGATGASFAYHVIRVSGGLESHDSLVLYPSQASIASGSFSTKDWSVNKHKAFEKINEWGKLWII